MVTLFVNAGRKDKIRPGDLLGALTANTDLSGKLIGKINIFDALRWVMGEQSVKQLRGKAMEDVIFAGARGKAPLNMAEVSLTILNDNGYAPDELKDFTEINVTRRL